MTDLHRVWEDMIQLPDGKQFELHLQLFISEIHHDSRH